MQHVGPAEGRRSEPWCHQAQSWSRLPGSVPALGRDVWRAIARSWPDFCADESAVACGRSPRSRQGLSVQDCRSQLSRGGGARSLRSTKFPVSGIAVLCCGGLGPPSRSPLSSQELVLQIPRSRGCPGLLSRIRHGALCQNDLFSPKAAPTMNFVPNRAPKARTCGREWVPLRLLRGSRLRGSRDGAADRPAIFTSGDFVARTVV